MKMLSFYYILSLVEELGKNIVKISDILRRNEYSWRYLLLLDLLSKQPVIIGGNTQCVKICEKW